AHSGKIAAALREGGHSHCIGYTGANTVAFESQEHERLVLDDRPAHVGAELILAVGRPRQARLVAEKGAGVEHLIAEVLVSRAVKLVGPGFARKVDDAV